jgi:hypothetical protein
MYKKLKKTVILVIIKLTSLVYNFFFKLKKLLKNILFVQTKSITIYIHVFWEYQLVNSFVKYYKCINFNNVKTYVQI